MPNKKHAALVTIRNLAAQLTGAEPIISDYHREQEQYAQLLQRQRAGESLHAGHLEHARQSSGELRANAEAIDTHRRELLRLVRANLPQTYPALSLLNTEVRWSTKAPNNWPGIVAELRTVETQVEALLAGAAARPMRPASWFRKHSPDRSFSADTIRKAADGERSTIRVVKGNGHPRYDVLDALANANWSGYHAGWQSQLEAEAGVPG